MEEKALIKRMAELIGLLLLRTSELKDHAGRSFFAKGKSIEEVEDFYKNNLDRRASRSYIKELERLLEKL